jgi:hypothetical protein
MDNTLAELKRNNEFLARLCLENRIGTPTWNIVLYKNNELIKILLKKMKTNTKLRKELNKKVV